MFGIASRCTKAKIKAPAFNILFLICKARALLPSMDGQVLARRSLETSPNSMLPNYAERGREYGSTDASLLGRADRRKPMY